MTRITYNVRFRKNSRMYSYHIDVSEPSMAIGEIAERLSREMLKQSGMSTRWRLGQKKQIINYLETKL